MQYTEGKVGRAFLLRLEHGEPLPEAVERFAASRGVMAAAVLIVGGVDAGSKLVVGPEKREDMPPRPMLAILSGVHEFAGVGIIAPDEHGRPRLHMHGAAGRGASTSTGCVRLGIRTWQVLEVLIVELSGLNAARLPDEQTGFSLLRCESEES